MSKHSTTEQLRELRTDTNAVAMLARLVVAELARSSLERLDVREYVRRKRAAERRRRALELGAAALVLSVAGIAIRHALHTPDGTGTEPASTA
jgi:hypothetical protein